LETSEELIFDRFGEVLDVFVAEGDGVVLAWIWEIKFAS
jgi:hypothetical protein